MDRAGRGAFSWPAASRRCHRPRLPFADDMPLQDLKHLFDWCQENSFALPAVNCISTSSIDAVLEATFRPLPTANLTLAGAYSTSIYRLRRRPRRRTRSSSSSRRVAASSSAASRPQRQRTTRLTTLTASFRCVHRSSSPPSACCRKSTGRHPLRASCLPGDDRRLDLARAPHPRRRAAVQSAGHHSLGPLREGADSLV